MLYKITNYTNIYKCCANYTNAAITIVLKYNYQTIAMEHN